MRGNTQQPDWLDYWYNERFESGGRSGFYPYATVTPRGGGYGGERTRIRAGRIAQETILHWKRR